MESNKFNLNIRALSNEEAFNSYKSYFKSALNFKPFTNRINKNDDFNYKRKSKNMKRDLRNLFQLDWISN